MSPLVHTVSVTYERKFNLGNYESANIGITIWANLEPDEDLSASMASLWQMAKDNVKAQALPLVARQQAEVEKIFLGLPTEVQETIE